MGVATGWASGNPRRSPAWTSFVLMSCSVIRNAHRDSVRHRRRAPSPPPPARVTTTPAARQQKRWLRNSGRPVILLHELIYWSLITHLRSQLPAYVLPAPDRKSRGRLRSAYASDLRGRATASRVAPQTPATSDSVREDVARRRRTFPTFRVRLRNASRDLPSVPRSRAR